MKNFKLFVKKYYIFLEITIYIFIVFILVYPICIKVSEHNKIENMKNDVLKYVEKVNQKKLKDDLYYSGDLNIDNSINSELLIMNNKISNGEFCIRNHQISYVENNIINITESCNLNSKKIKNTEIKYNIEKIDECSDSKKIIFDVPKNIKIQYMLLDLNSNVIENWTDVENNELVIKDNGLLKIRLKNNLVTSNEKNILITTIDKDNVEKYKPTIKSINGDKIVILNEMKNVDISLDEKCLINKNKILYGYTDSLKKSFKYQESNEFKIEKNKKYFFKTKIKFSKNDDYIESEILKYDNIKSCVINVRNDDKLTYYKMVSITSYGKGDLEYKIVSKEENTDWIKYNNEIKIAYNADRENPVKIYCRMKDKKVLNQSSKIITDIDSERPTIPNVKLFIGDASKNKVYGEYISGEKTDKDVKVVLKSVDNRKIDHYEYSHNLKNWKILNKINMSEDGEKISYWINWNGAWWYYFRSVDEAGLPSMYTKIYVIDIDKNSY